MTKLLFNLLFSSLLFAQNKSLNIYIIADTAAQYFDSNSFPSPIYGWKEFCNKIQYPLEEYNNDVQCSFDLGIKIDSLGNIKKINSFGDDNRNTFLHTIEELINSTIWLPAISNGKKIECYLEIPIIYSIKRFDTPFPLVIEGDHWSTKHTIKFNDFNATREETDTLIKGWDSVFYIGSNSPNCANYSAPSPTEGFDTLITFANNHFFQRAGISTTKIIDLHFNEFGKIDSIYSSNYYSFLVEDFIDKIKNLKWLPATKNRITVRSSLSLPIVFYLKNDGLIFPKIVEVIKCGAL